MLVQIITENGQKKIIPLTADAGAGNPVGSLLHTYKKSNPSGYLYCDGSTFDQTKYPLLYAYLGSNVLPDYREVVEVGAEQNATDSIATHDVYTEGQFKDDQLQEHNHTLNAQSVAVSGSGVVMYGSEYSSVYTTNTTSGRTGTTTHGKQKAVFVYIKATSGLTEGQQDDVANIINGERSYSTDEINTGKKWIDGKPIYKKVVDFGTLPNNTTKNVAHNISNCGYITDLRGIMTDGTNYHPIPYVTNSIYNVTIYAGNTNISIVTYADLTAFNAKVILEYTKTT